MVDVARVNRTKVSPQPARNVAVGFLSGLVVGMVLAFGMSYLSDFLHDAHEITGVVPAPVLGTIPDFRGSRARMVASWLPWKPGWLRRPPSQAVITSTSSSDAAEAYRSFRTALLQSGRSVPPRSLLFLSGSEGEGRTTTCVNTAAAFAAQGYSVLVVDADMRSAQDGRYGIPAGAPGLSSCLAEAAFARDLIQPFPGVANLSFLPPGPRVPNTVELLGGTVFQALLANLLTTFDYVFLDSPPALTTADARVIAQAAEGYVVVVRADQTTSRNLRRLADWMQTSSHLPVGVCLNAAEL